MSGPQQGSYGGWSDHNGWGDHNGKGGKGDPTSKGGSGNGGAGYGGGKGSGGPPRRERAPRDREQVSKILSRFLRHNPDQQLKMGPDGFVKFDEMLGVTRLSVDEVLDVAEEWSKNKRGERRFDLTERDGVFMIRATSGHSETRVSDYAVRGPLPGVSCGREDEYHIEICRKARVHFRRHDAPGPAQAEPHAAARQHAPAVELPARDPPAQLASPVSQVNWGHGRDALPPRPVPPDGKSAPKCKAPLPPPPNQMLALADTNATAATATPAEPPAAASGHDLDPCLEVAAPPAGNSVSVVEVSGEALGTYEDHDLGDGYLRFKKGDRLVQLPEKEEVEGWIYGYHEDGATRTHGWFPMAFFGANGKAAARDTVEQPRLCDEDASVVGCAPPECTYDLEVAAPCGPPRELYAPDGVAAHRPAGSTGVNGQQTPYAPNGFDSTSSMSWTRDGGVAAQAEQPLSRLAAEEAAPVAAPHGRGDGIAAAGRLNGLGGADHLTSAGARARAFVQDAQFAGAVAKLGKAVEGKRVLDVGCGAGVVSCWCAAMGAASVVGVDASDQALEIARSMVADNGLGHKVALRAGAASDGEDAEVLLSGGFLMDLCYGNQLVQLIAARRHLRPGGQILPHSCWLYVCAADYSAEAAYTTEGEAWLRCQRSLGLDLGMLGASSMPRLTAQGGRAALASDDVLPADLDVVFQDRLASMEAHEVLNLHLPTAEIEDALPRATPFRVELRTDRCATALVLFLAASLAPQVEVAAAPRDGSAPCAGRQLVLHLPALGPPLRPLCLPGSSYEAVAGTLSMTRRLPAASGAEAVLMVHVEFHALARGGGKGRLEGSATYELPV